MTDIVIGTVCRYPVPLSSLALGLDAFQADAIMQRRIWVCKLLLCVQAVEESHNPQDVPLHRYLPLPHLRAEVAVICV